LNSSETRFQNQNIQIRIQAIYMFGYRDITSVHAEYLIPRTNLPVDLLDSITGEMWEIKPWDDRGQATAQLDGYVIAMMAAKRARLLTGMTPYATRYDWNEIPARWFRGQSFPGEIYVGTDDTGYHHIFAGQVEPGVIAWWKYKSPRPVDVPVPIYIPANMKWNERNKRPG
jgi:hypothetical protein